MKGIIKQLEACQDVFETFGGEIGRMEDYHDAVRINRELIGRLKDMQTRTIQFSYTVPEMLEMMGE